MTLVEDSAWAVLALTNRLVDVGVAALKASEFWRLLDDVGDPAKLIGRSAAELTVDLNGRAADAERVATLLDSGMTLAVRLEALRERGIWTVTPFNSDYPSALRTRLGSSAPPVLYGAGNAALLGSFGIGIVGSRDVDDQGAEVAQSATRAATSHGLSVISGGARGVDQLAMDAATDAGGNALGVLADSLERSIAQADTRRALLAGELCLCTPYRPDARFTVGNAMGRNKIVYSLSRVTLVVACDAGSGGTWTGASEALDKRYGRVAVWRGAGEGPGNEALQRAGALAVSQVEDLLAIEPLGDAKPQAEQLSLEALLDRLGKPPPS
jgi:predicted Rossmann fold nucleotide-binding protein DprA/Smf involved in DNA uptake